MACPPEDCTGFEGMGSRAYQDFLDHLLAYCYCYYYYYYYSLSLGD